MSEVFKVNGSTLNFGDLSTEELTERAEAAFARRVFDPTQFCPLPVCVTNTQTGGTIARDEKAAEQKDYLEIFEEKERQFQAILRSRFEQARKELTEEEERLRDLEKRPSSKRKLKICADTGERP